MEVLVKKYVSGTFVETYEQTFEVPEELFTWAVEVKQQLDNS